MYLLHWCGYNRWSLPLEVIPIILEIFSIEFQRWSWIALVLLYFALWLVQKTYATISTNQIQNLNQSPFGHSRFPALQAGCLFYFEFSLVTLFCLKAVVTLVLDFRTLVENCYIFTQMLSSSSPQHFIRFPRQFAGNLFILWGKKRHCATKRRVLPKNTTQWSSRVMAQTSWPGV